MSDMAQSTVVYNTVCDFLKHVFCFLATVCAFCDFLLDVIETFAEISLEVHGFALSVCKWMFLSIFLLEIVVKLCIGFKMFWKCCRNVANLLISFTCIVGCRVTKDPKVLAILKVLRAIRMIICFTLTQDSRRLVQVIKKSLVDVSIILIPFMLFILVYTASGVNLFRSAISEFQSLQSALHILFTCLHQEGCGDTFNHLKEERITGLLYFTLFVICAILFWAYDDTVFMSNSEMFLQDIMNGESPAENNDSEDRPGQKDFKDQAIIHVEKVIKQTNMTKRQKPLMNGYPLNLTLETYENAFLVLSSIEINLEGGHELEREINNILMKLHLDSANRKQIYRPKIHEKGTCCIDEELATGDILTALINLDKANILDTTTVTPQLSEGMTLDIGESVKDSN